MGAALWTFLAVISFLYLGRVYKFFRTSGLEERAREQVCLRKSTACGAVTSTAW